MSLCLASQFGPPFLVPIPGPEQPKFFFSTRGVDQSLRGAATAQGPRLGPSALFVAPK